MKSLFAFINKEMIEHVRAGKIIVLGLLFTLFGIMNPAIAKLTPWLLEQLSDSLAQNGMVITTVTVSAVDSWAQFFKNIPIALIIFVLMESSIYTKEYQTGTLLLFLTKGLQRYKVILSKTVMLIGLWTVLYWVCFGITYGYNAYFWDNAIVPNLFFSGICWWLFGLGVMGLVTFFSIIANANTGVLLGTGGVILLFYLLGMVPKWKMYMPTMLTDGNALIYGVAETGDYKVAVGIMALIAIFGITGSIPVFNRKQL